MWCFLFLLFLLRSEYYWPSDVTNDDDRAFSFVFVVYLIIQIPIKNLLMPSTVKKKKKKRKKRTNQLFFFFFFCLVVCWLRWIASALFPTVFPLLGARALHDDSKQRCHRPPWWWSPGVRKCFVARSHSLSKEWRRRRRRYFFLSFFLTSPCGLYCRCDTNVFERPARYRLLRNTRCLFWSQVQSESAAA